MQYFYKKLLLSGQIQKGLLEAASIEDARSNILDAGELLLELKAIKNKKYSKFSLEMKHEFTYQMHQLISAGLPIYESILSLKEKKVSYSFILDKLASSIKEGNSFSQSILSLKETFDPLYIAIIQASETSGEIKDGFLSLKLLLERQLRIVKTLKNAFVYPTILLIFALIIVHGLFFFIIPSLSELFEGRQLQGLTKIILSMSDLACSHTTAIFISYTLCAVSFALALKNGLLQKALMAFLKRIPFCYSLFLSLKFENFFSCLAQLLERGINLKEALELSKNVLRQPELEKSVDLIKKDILKGKKFSESLIDPFPSVAKRLISLSEETGRLSESCQMLSQIFSEEVEKKLQKLTTFIQPVLLALIGLIVGIVILSILMPLTDVGGFL